MVQNWNFTVSRKQKKVSMKNNSKDSNHSLLECLDTPFCEQVNILISIMTFMMNPNHSVSILKAFTLKLVLVYSKPLFSTLTLLMLPIKSFYSNTPLKSSVLVITCYLASWLRLLPLFPPPSIFPFPFLFPSSPSASPFFPSLPRSLPLLSLASPFQFLLLLLLLH